MLEEEMNRVGSENIGNLLCLGGDFQVCGIRVFFFFFLWHKNYLCMRDNSMDFVENIQFYEPKDSKMFKGLSRTHHEAILSSHRRTEESRERVKEFFFFFLLFIIRYIVESGWKISSVSVGKK